MLERHYDASGRPGEEVEYLIPRAPGTRAAAASGKIALLYGMENGSPLEGSLANLEHFWKRGVRYITLTHGKDNHLCDSSYDPTHTHKGLSSFGREVVRRVRALFGAEYAQTYGLTETSPYLTISRLAPDVLATLAGARVYRE